MRVYELIQELAKMPAGNKVEVHMALSVKGLMRGKEVDTDANGDPVYSINGLINDIDSGEGYTCLYLDW